MLPLGERCSSMARSSSFSSGVSCVWGSGSPRYLTGPVGRCEPRGGRRLWRPSVDASTVANAIIAAPPPPMYWASLEDGARGREMCRAGGIAQGGREAAAGDSDMLPAGGLARGMWVVDWVPPPEWGRSSAGYLQDLVGCAPNLVELAQQSYRKLARFGGMRPHFSLASAEFGRIDFRRIHPS